VSDFAQTHVATRITLRSPLERRTMHTAAECRAIALAKREEAQRNKRRRKSLTQAAKAWRLLALRVSQLESRLKDRHS
jgi:hypothetical protein